MINIIFIVSFAVIVFLILIKAIQLRFGEFGLIKNTLDKTDEKIDNMIYSLIMRYNYYKKVSAIFVFDFLPSLTYEMLVKMKDGVARRYYNSGNEFRGRRVLRSDGSVSSFLERLSEDK